MKTRAHDTTGAPSLAERFLLRVVDAGLAGCILIVPLLMGGRHPLGQLVLVALAVAVALAWTAGACLAKQTPWQGSGGVVVLLAAVGLLILQWVPLPDWVLAMLSPRMSEMLPLWAADSETAIRPGRWSQVSLVPGATGACLVMLLAYGMLFWVTLQRIRSVNDVERLLRWCGWAALAMASFALVQWFAGNGKFFWFHEARFSNTSDVAKGSFTNPNHFAHFLALGTGALIWLIQDRFAKSRLHKCTGDTSAARAILWVLGLGLVLFAGTMSLSRGGMVAIVLAGAIMVFVCHRAKMLKGRLAATLVGTAVIVGAALAIYGHPAVGREMDSIVSGSVDTLDPGQRRRVVWTACLHAASDFAVLGSGAGSHRWVCPGYLDPEQLPGAAALAGRIYFTHAENGLLQTAVETGMPGVLLLISGIGLIGYWCFVALRRADSRRAMVAAGALCAALAASLVHGMVDFVWHVPACMAMVAIFCGAVCRLAQLARQSQRDGSTIDLCISSEHKGCLGHSEAVAQNPRISGPPLRYGPGTQLDFGISTLTTLNKKSFGPRRAWVAMSLLVVVGGWMIANRVGPALAEPHWQNSWQLARGSTIDVKQLHGADMYGDVKTAQTRLLENSLRQIIDELEEVVRLDPTRVEARLQLAGSYLLLFEYAQQQSDTNTMPLASIREAAMASRFSSRAELDSWLTAAVGKSTGCLESARRHTRRALQLCPLQGAGYLYLGELCFLDGAESREAVRRCVAQALQVRPFDGDVLISAGQEAVIDGAMDRAIGYWQRAYRLGPAYRRALVGRLAGHVCPADPTADLDFFLDAFEPELETVRQLEVVYASLAEGDRIARLRDRHARLAAVEARQSGNPRRACQLWMEARLAHLKHGQTDAAIDCLCKAVECDPNNTTARRRLALGLMKQEQYTRAMPHLQWCLAREPADRSLRTALRECTRNQIKSDKRSTLADRESNIMR